MNSVPALRIRTLNSGRMNHEGGYVLYWMTSARRLGWNYALDRAADWCVELGKPLVILEGLTLSYPWASARFHRFVMDGMVEKAEAKLPKGVRYIPYVEPEARAGRGMVDALAAEASVVVCDDFPCFFIPRIQAAAAGRASVRFEAVDGNGLLPMVVADRTFKAAYHFRRFLQKSLPDHLLEAPEADGLDRLAKLPQPVLPKGFAKRWPATGLTALKDEAFLADLNVDQAVAPTGLAGGEGPARATMEAFLSTRLAGYDQDRNHPDRDSTSSLSPYLHWGHISTHEVFHALSTQEGWSPLRLSPATNGKREGWWGMTPPAEAFLDQLITWRELGFNMSSREEDYDRYESLPKWARETLESHRKDPRPWTYELEAFDNASTHDPIWNAAQRQLTRTGMIHNYLRMLWGKKILEWSEDPRTALSIMIELNNRYALDGRDPNSYSGIFWILGRYDRGWPQRPVFGVVRSMSSDATRRKVDLADYLEQYG